MSIVAICPLEWRVQVLEMEQHTKYSHMAMTQDTEVWVLLFFFHCHHSPAPPPPFHHEQRKQMISSQAQWGTWLNKIDLSKPDLICDLCH